MAFERFIKSLIQKESQAGRYGQAALWSNLGDKLQKLKDEGLNDPESLPNFDEGKRPEHDIEVDRRKKLAVVDGRPCKLSKQTLKLLDVLSSGSDENPVNLETIMERTGFKNDNSALVWIRRLREDIETNPDVPEILRNVRGVGYYLRAGTTFKDK
ncbi:hypothetical protein A3A76_05695 [Candidatus Woesebacteria bacterium RIFCSPLOWO2_01_FULL_39_23]|uniref:OmpR/PhoB-type domain-containing protein n=1 Tax=Candidatus Woesebacteria bacterium RIFCSPHIGHO2_01_FULL_40_22 TaxID=1802499 RepID=A0A1F7YKZ0_9BACT|nr:MAG: hypothetical protein A2141_03615 [Candidatus Woesebacteria bacterium RBG_16_40_11]OGM27947.1 MAG: hypothetical protein A2628_03620 [Candidatus Woesebacteria bacterium RIFCSPHIGHO2_01_FULL_40_22]OGM37551.1 MAG: hypothetical protein A3E41_01845 [Candidatus Woesebacteria bacterium RIFCSPHIGHO2_12_FULL_38_9]OGM61703.1 MAG: hypothetical protein A3A76_05695 [Candidatus Woesebacteria bacterium RIFCSPLOWO2_01_FULL_39_23]